LAKGRELAVQRVSEVPTIPSRLPASPKASQIKDRPLLEQCFLSCGPVKGALGVRELAIGDSRAIVATASVEIPSKFQAMAFC
jgi:hypothetical protein